MKQGTNAIPAISRRSSQQQRRYFMVCLLVVSVQLVFLGTVVDKFVRSVIVDDVEHSALSSPSSIFCTTTSPPQQKQRELSLIGSPRTLPSFDHRGGLMIFFHVAKNAGTTLRRFLMQRYGDDRLELHWSTNFASQLPLMRRMVEGLAEDQSQTLVVEIHNGLDPTLPELELAISNLRQRAQVNQVPFFVFSTFRDPLSYAVSFYNFQNMGGLAQIYKQGNKTERDFLRLSLPSPQCLFFARGELATTKEFDIYGRNLTHEECLTTYQAMTRTIDWIGTVDKVQTETLPLLAYMMEGGGEPGRAAPVTNIEFEHQNPTLNLQRKINIHELSSFAIQQIQTRMQSDGEIYQRVQRDYPIHMWKNYPNTRPIV